MIAALYVERGGVYFGLPNVDPWDIERDARLYAGPHPVVAHPPCERWGRYWGGGPMLQGTPNQKKLGDDGGCFAAALHAVRTWGGVLEHPEGSHAWRTHGLTPPLRGGGWSVADGLAPRQWPDCVGWTCCVEQGHYGHRARKATWLYANYVVLPTLAWGRSKASVLLDDGFHSKEERELVRRPPKNMTPAQREFRKRWLARRAQDGAEWCAPERMNRRERMATPIPFRDLLISIAESVNARRAA